MSIIEDIKTFNDRIKDEIDIAIRNFHKCLLKVEKRSRYRSNTLIDASNREAKRLKNRKRKCIF